MIPLQVTAHARLGGAPSPSTSTGCRSAALGRGANPLAGGSCLMLKPTKASAGAAAAAAVVSAAPTPTAPACTCAAGAPSVRAASADQTSLARLSTPSATRSIRASAHSHAKTASPPASPPVVRSSNPTAARRARPPLALSTRDCSALLVALKRRLLASSGASATFCA